VEDHIRLSSLVVELVERYKNRITIYIIDPQSLLGFYKSLRHWVRKYPTFIVDGHEKITGWNLSALSSALESRFVG